MGVANSKEAVRTALARIDPATLLWQSALRSLVGAIIYSIVRFVWWSEQGSKSIINLESYRSCVRMIP